MEQQLSLPEYKRYGRQMILDGFGLPGQLKLKNASIVVVGAGGLGSPALQSLAAAGPPFLNDIPGKIGIVDHDNVELSNLQRQIIHDESTIGISKARSAARFIARLNSNIQVDAISEALLPANALALLSPYDIILDCTDNAPTRYLLSDTAVRLGKPLVSGAAQKYDGQLCTYNLGENGPCYRCLFPKPPTSEMAPTCEETGILGVVTNTIGNLQALEAIKILLGVHEQKPSMLLFSALSLSQFRSIKLRSKKNTCPACGEGNNRIGSIQEIDYVQFCGGTAPDWTMLGLVDGTPGQRITAKDFKNALNADLSPKIIDVRPKGEYGICQLPNSQNIPLLDLVANPANIEINGSKSIYVVCRLGNDSQVAAHALREILPKDTIVMDLIGGLQAWSKDVDSQFPIY